MVYQTTSYLGSVYGCAPACAIDRFSLVGDRFGGTLAPTMRLEVSGTRAWVAEQLGYGSIPAMAERIGASGSSQPAEVTRRVGGSGGS